MAIIKMKEHPEFIKKQPITRENLFKRYRQETLDYLNREEFRAYIEKLLKPVSVQTGKIDDKEFEYKRAVLDVGFDPLTGKPLQNPNIFTVIRRLDTDDIRLTYIWLTGYRINRAILYLDKDHHLLTQKSKFSSTRIREIEYSNDNGIVPFTEEYDDALEVASTLEKIDNAGRVFDFYQNLSALFKAFLFF